jgi:hypothetical protein
MLNEGNQIHNFISSSGAGTVINYGSGSEFLTSFGSGSGSTSKKVTVLTFPVPVPQRCVQPATLKLLPDARSGHVGSRRGCGCSRLSPGTAASGCDRSRWLSRPPPAGSGQGRAPNPHT